MHELMFGDLCLWVALLGSLTSIVLYSLVSRGNKSLRSWARLAYVMTAQGIIWAAVHLMFLVWHHRFEVNYVAEYSSRDLQPFYLMSSFWAGQQGTFFLWAIYGCVLGVLFMVRSPRSYEPTVMVVLSTIEAFLSLLLVSKSPFILAAQGQIPADGQGLNVLLQNHWMVIHPPIMFLGFSSLAVPFAIGISALVRRSYDDWIQVAWPWALFAWSALGTGLFMGGYWAYTVLGWGGFWGWDNVENSSLIPWLATTALIHGMLLQKARGSMKRANLLFAITPYLLVLFGSFLTRSGILADFSVHSFAAPDRIIYWLLLAFVIFFFVTASGILIWRVRSAPTQVAFNTEGERGFFFVIASWMLYATSLLVLYGTSYPLLSKIWGKQANVSPSFYNHWLFPVAILFCLMMGATPFLKWHGKPAEGTPRILGGCLAGAAVLAMLLTVGNAYFFGESMQAPVDALVRSNPSAYQAPAPSKVILGDRTAAVGAVTTPTDGSRVLEAGGGSTFAVPAVPKTFAEAYRGALRIRYGMAYPCFAFAALFCILANGVMIVRMTGVIRRSWFPAAGHLCHVGVGVLFVGIITSLNYGGDAVLNMDPGRPLPTKGDSVDFDGGTPIAAFGHTFTFQGFDIESDGHKASMKIGVQTGDETIVARPSLTMAHDGNIVHFPSIRKYWLEDLYLSPIKLPGMDMDNNQEFRFHVALEVSRLGKTSTISPGVSFMMGGGMKPTDTPLIPGTPYQVAVKTFQTPTKDAPDRQNFVDLTIQRQGTFQKEGGATVHIPLNQAADFGDYHIRYVRFDVDKETQDAVAERKQEAKWAQVQVSTKPLINLVWLGTMLIACGGFLSARRRTLEARRKGVAAG